MQTQLGGEAYTRIVEAKGPGGEGGGREGLFEVVPY